MLLRETDAGLNVGGLGREKFFLLTKQCQKHFLV